MTEQTTADQIGLCDRIADAVIPLLLDTLPKVIARARGYEVADAVLAVLPDQQAAIRAVAFEQAADMLAQLDPVKAALAGQHAWNDAAGLVRHMAAQERRMAAGAQQQGGLRGLLEHVGIDTTGRDITVDGKVVDAGAQQQDDTETRCTCADAGDCFAPADHYADCPQGAQQQPAVPQRAYPDCERCGDTGIDPEQDGNPCPECQQTEEQPAVAGEEDTPRCVCGDPIELQNPTDPTSWIHCPGSKTVCLVARPRL